MAYTSPQLNLHYEYWKVTTNVNADPPTDSGDCALLAPSRTFLTPIPAPVVGAIPELASLYLPIQFLALPATATPDVPRTDTQNVGGTFLLTLSGVNCYYQVLSIAIVAAGWPNEYMRVTVVECTEAWLWGTGNPWGVPVPP